LRAPMIKRSALVFLNEGGLYGARIVDHGKPFPSGFAVWNECPPFTRHIRHSLLCNALIYYRLFGQK